MIEWFHGPHLGGIAGRVWPGPVGIVPFPIPLHWMTWQLAYAVVPLVISVDVAHTLSWPEIGNWILTCALAVTWIFSF